MASLTDLHANAAVWGCGALNIVEGRDILWRICLRQENGMKLPSLEGDRQRAAWVVAAAGGDR